MVTGSARGLLQGLPHGRDGLAHGPALVGEVDDHDAPVVFGGLADEQAGVLHAAQGLGDGGVVEADAVEKFGLGLAVPVEEVHQHQFLSGMQIHALGAGAAA